jgi:hypothetical protein
LGNGIKLRFEEWDDYGGITAVNAADKPLEISFADIKEALLDFDLLKRNSC